MKAKFFAAILVSVWAGGVVAAPPKTAKPIPEAFHGKWVGGYIAGKPLTEKQIAMKCSYKYGSEGGVADVDYIDYDKYYKNNTKFQSLSIFIDSEKIGAVEVSYDVMHAMDWDEYPIKYSRYTENHIQGIIEIPADEEDGPIVETGSKDKFNYRVDGDKLYLLNKKGFPKKFVLTRCPD